MIYVTGIPIEPAIVDYYLQMLPGVPGARTRASALDMLSCHDANPRAGVTEKVLARPQPSWGGFGPRSEIPGRRT